MYTLAANKWVWILMALTNVLTASICVVYGITEAFYWAVGMVVYCAGGYYLFTD